MLKKEIYPKTQRVKNNGDKVYLTEKLDGSNLVFFKKNDKLLIAQRKTIYTLDELDDVKDICYKGLYQWLKDNGQALQDELRNDSAICGEWLGMGNLKYTVDEFDKRWYMFAKANIDDNYNLYNIIYTHELFVYPFLNLEIPNYLGKVPEIEITKVLPTKEHLDSIYNSYCMKVNRNVEGIVINYKNSVTKYVRMKSGKLVEYDEADHKNNEMKEGI